MLYDPKWEVSTPTKVLEPWRRLLLRAAAVIEDRGHTKFTVEDDGRVCLFGALNVANHGASHYRNLGVDEYPEAANAICRHLGVKDARDAADWNNAPERTLDEVTAALRAAAET